MNNLIASSETKSQILLLIFFSIFLCFRICSQKLGFKNSLGFVFNRQVWKEFSFMFPMQYCFKLRSETAWQFAAVKRMWSTSSETKTTASWHGWAQKGATIAVQLCQDTPENWFPRTDKEMAMWRAASEEGAQIINIVLCSHTT